MNTDNLPEINRLLFFKTFQKQTIIQKFQELLDLSQKNHDPTIIKTQGIQLYYDLKSEIISRAMTGFQTTPYAKTPWKNIILTEILAEENPMTLLMEKEVISINHPFYKLFCKEIEILTKIIDFDWEIFLKETALDSDRILTAPVFQPTPDQTAFSTAFKKDTVCEALKAFNDYVLKNGLGRFEKNRCFKFDLKTAQLVPIRSRNDKKMTDLVGYDSQKQALLENTAAFVKNHRGLNVLLQGDMGTGKSTMVKALLNDFTDSRLRMIEMKRSQISVLPEIINTIAHRPYPFIIFIDDLSFDDNDEDFMLFKNCLEGSLEDNPENVRIYATSNKRHLITETRSEREDAIHARDILQEKLSLTARFSLVLNFSAPNQEDYLKIVSYLAFKAGLTIKSAELESKALQWEKRHLNRSGRTAEQLIEYLLTQTE